MNHKRCWRNDSWHIWGTIPAFIQSY